jgi:hypothetical protein
MRDDNVLFCVILLFIIVICSRMYYLSDEVQLKCVISSVDGNRYCVRDRSQLEAASDMLADVNRRCKTLIIFLVEKFPDRKDVQRLNDKFKTVKITETLPTSEHTAYSENKGEKLAFCLNKSKDEHTKLIDINTLTFVALHELSHIMTISEGHKRIFWENFKFLLDNAVEVGIYDPVDYKNNPKKYCGMELTDNPYYDIV